MHRTTIRAVVVAGLVGLGLPLAGAAFAQSAPPHVQLTRDEDFNRTRAQLGLRGDPPAGADSTSPATFDEATANPFPG